MVAGNRPGILPNEASPRFVRPRKKRILQLEVAVLWPKQKKRGQSLRRGPILLAAIL